MGVAAILFVLTIERPVKYVDRFHRITNSTEPDEVDAHFKGNGLQQVPASTFGLPDGTCWIYSNQTSWVVIKCFGGVVTPQ